MTSYTPTCWKQSWKLLSNMSSSRNNAENLVNKSLNQMVYSYLMKLRLHASSCGILVAISWWALRWPIKNCLHWMTFTECWRTPRVPNKLLIYFSFCGVTWPVNLILLGHFSLQHLLWTANLSQHVFWRPSNCFSFIDSKQVLIVCNGASSNISAIKKSHGHTGAYSLKDDQDDNFKIEPWVENPFSPLPQDFFGWFVHPTK